MVEIICGCGGRDYLCVWWWSECGGGVCVVCGGGIFVVCGGIIGVVMC